SISGLHVGFLAAWLVLLLRHIGLGPRGRAAAAALLLIGYLWLLAFPAPATRAVVMLVTAEVARLRQRVVAPRGVIALSGLVLALVLSWVVAGLAHLLAAGAGLGLALLDLIAAGAAQVPGGHVVTTAGWQAAALWAGVALAAWWLWHSPRRPWLIGARVAFA